MEKFEGFKEITFTILDDNDKEHEIMFDILSNGKVISIYCYKDGIPKYFNRRDDLVPIKTKPGKNPLFVHIVPNKNNISKLLGYSSHPFLETMDDYELVHKMLHYYDIKLDTTSWGDIIEESFSGDNINLLEKYLSVKFQRPIKILNSRSMLFEYDKKRLLKLEKNQNLDFQLALYNYLKDSKGLPIAKIYDVGKIQIPKKIVKEIHPYWVDNRIYIYHIMERVSIPNKLSSQLLSIDGSKDDINNYYDEKIIDEAVLYELADYLRTGDQSRVYDIQQYFYNEEPLKLYKLLERIIYILQELDRNGISWNDVHSDQFGYNHKGELVAFDLDGLETIDDEKLFLTNTNIKEGKYVKTFESFKMGKHVKKFFKGLKYEIQETDELRKIFLKHLYKKPITDEEKKFVKEQSLDLLRMLGIGMIIPLPASSIIIPSLIISAKKLGVELVPKGFRMEESMSTEEIIDLIQDGTNIYVKYIYDFDEHDPKKSYKPVDIDDDGNITLDIDNELFYTKLDWVEGIEENLQNYEVDPSMTDPLDDMERKERGEHWKTDKEFKELLRDQGGIKGVIKKMKKVYDLDYSDCENEEDLYNSLNMDNML